MSTLTLKDDVSVLRPVRVPTGPGVSLSTDSWLPSLVGFGIPFLLVFTLALGDGGYDLVLRSQVGLIVWWVLLLGLSVGLLPFQRVSRVGWIAMGIFAGLIAITAIATLTWTESAERSFIELSRITMIFGAFVLMLLIQGREAVRRSLAAVAVAVAVVAVIALVDRFDPGLLPFGSSQLLPADYPRARLNFPVEYWNALAALIAIGLGSLLWLATSARDRLVRSVAAGVIPLTVLATFMTASRGGTASAFLAVLVLVLLFPERLRLALISFAPAVGSALLIVMVNSRPEVRDLVAGEAAASQGIEMIWTCLAVVAVVSGLQYLIASLIEADRIRLPRVDRGLTRKVGLGVGATVLVLLLAGIVSGRLSDRWSEFQEPSVDGTVSRLTNVNSSERYLLWDSALGAASSEKLTGIGPGSFEYWWAREGDGQQFVRDAHNLYLEMLAEAGPLAFLLILTLVFGPIAMGVLLSARAGSAERRTTLAAATAGMSAFALAAGVDWAWEMTVLPVAFFALAATLLGPEDRPARTGRLGGEPTSGHPPLAKPWVRVTSAAGALLAIGVIAVPLAATQAFESSQKFVREGDLEQALTKAERASDLQPWAASPRVQQAQVLGLLGRQTEAVELAQEAIDREPGNWRNWLVLSQLLAESSSVRAERARERARELNPKSELPELGIPGSTGG